VVLAEQESVLHSRMAASEVAHRRRSIHQRRRLEHQIDTPNQVKECYGLISPVIIVRMNRTLVAGCAIALTCVAVAAQWNREEQFNMTNEKVIMLIEAKIQPQRRAELVEAVRQYLPSVRAESGVEAFYVMARKDDPNTFVFYEIYRSQAAQDFHLQQDFTKKFLATLKSAQVGDRVRTNLVELAPEVQTQSK
jgi:quinol monooxygenase YgiN